MMAEPNSRPPFLRGGPGLGSIPEGYIGIAGAYHKLIDRLCNDYDERRIASDLAFKARDRRCRQIAKQLAATDRSRSERGEQHPDKERSWEDYCHNEANFHHDAEYRELRDEADARYARLCEVRAEAETKLLDALKAEQLKALYRERLQGGHAPLGRPDTVPAKVWWTPLVRDRYPGFLNNQLPATFFAERLEQRYLEIEILFLNEKDFERWLEAMDTSEAESPQRGSALDSVERDPRLPRLVNGAARHRVKRESALAALIALKREGHDLFEHRQRLYQSVVQWCKLNHRRVPGERVFYQALAEVLQPTGVQ